MRGIGKLNESRLVLEKIAQIDSSENKAATLLSLGNTFVALGDLERDRELAKFSRKYEYQPWRCSRINSILIKEAVEEYKLAESRYQQIIKQFPTTSIAIKAKLNLLKILLVRSKFNSSSNNDTTDSLSKAESLLSEINILNLPPKQNLILAQINLAKSSACLAQLKGNQPDWIKIAKQLQIAKNKAEKIGDNRAKSYAIGNIGGLYEFYAWSLEQNSNKAKNVKNNLCQTANDCRQKAQQLTEEALYLVQPSKEPFIAYQLQSQLGNLLDKQGKRDDAIKAYNGAIKTLESVSDNLLAIDSDVQFSFLENIEPVYRSFLQLLLEEKANDDDFKRATEVSEQLQLAELENLLRCSFDFSKTIAIGKLNQSEKSPAAIINPIIFPDRVEVIVQIPSKVNTDKIYRKTSLFRNKGEDFDFILFLMTSVIS